MLAALQRWLSPEQAQPDTEVLLRKAAALLMLEVAQADDDFDVKERTKIKQLIISTYDLSTAECDELLALAERESEELLSIQGLTRLLVEQLEMPERQQVIEQLWRVAYADGRLDVYEEHMIRRIADLLYLPHASYIQAKLSASPTI